jgi:hypothetical protein
MEELAKKASAQAAERLDGAAGPSMFIRNNRRAVIVAEDLVVG